MYIVAGGMIFLLGDALFVGGLLQREIVTALIGFLVMPGGILFGYLGKKAIDRLFPPSRPGL